MADSKNNSNEEAQVAEQPAVAPEAPAAPVVEEPVAVEGENLYFFPDIQKSVVAKSAEEATKQVQAELDALKKEGN